MADAFIVGQDERRVAFKTFTFHAAFDAIRKSAVAVEAYSVFQGEVVGAGLADAGPDVAVGAG